MVMRHRPAFGVLAAAFGLAAGAATLAAQARRAAIEPGSSKMGRRANA